MLTPQRRKTEYDDHASFFKQWYGDEWATRLRAGYCTRVNRLHDAESRVPYCVAESLLIELRRIRSELESFAREALAGRRHTARDSSDVRR